MRILHLLSSNKYSGAENVVCQIIHMLRENVNMEMVYCSPDGPVRQALADRSVLFVPIHKLSVAAVKKVIQEVKPDIVHAHDMKASFVAAAAVGRIPLISHVHNNNFDSQKPTLKAILYRYAAAKAKHIFWVSQSSMTGYYFHNGLEKKSTVLYNVIDGEQLRQKAAQAECQAAYDIIYIGRLTYQKNPQRLIKVLKEVVKQQPNLKAAVIGIGDLEAEVQQLVAEENLQDNVHCLGFMSNPYGILKNSKVMLMTSRWEGTPMCALEAMALGVPIVSTPTDGLCELVENGKTGYLSDEDGALIRACVEIVNEPDRWMELSAATKARSEEMMNIENYRSTLLNVYDNALA